MPSTAARAADSVVMVGMRPNGSAPDGLLIELGIDTVRRIDDPVDALALDEIHDVGAAFFDFVDALDRHAARSSASVVPSARPVEAETHVH